MKQLNLSKRLSVVSSFIPKGSYFADIGSDHAYLPCYVCLQDDSAKAIAGEVNIGPYNSAKKTVETYHLANVIDVRLGDGLEVIKDDSVQTVVIAGMGGGLITSILENGKRYLHSVDCIITQPNIDARSIRKWMKHNNFTLIDECLVEENNHIYEVLVAHRNPIDNPYTAESYEKEVLFGPILLNEKSKLFMKKWKQEYKHKKQIIEDINKSKNPELNKIATIKKELAWIKEVLEASE